MEFVNKELMEHVKQQLIIEDKHWEETGELHVDPLFGSFFREVIDLTDEIVPRFSCEGHYHWVVPVDEERCRLSEMSGDVPVEEGAFIQFYSDPYISFLCTEKGFEIIRLFFRALVNKTIECGYNPTIYQLTESVYYCDNEDHPFWGETTGRITLRVEPRYDENFIDHHKEIITLIKTTLLSVCSEFNK